MNDDLCAAIAALDSAERRAMTVAMAEMRDRYVKVHPRRAHVYAVLAATFAEIDAQQRRMIAAMEDDVSGPISVELPGEAEHPQRMNND